MYSNCKMLGPTGADLALIDEKRAHWYLEHGLATKVADDPLTIQLNFSPKGPGKREDSFYLTPRASVCVVCGTTKNLTKHHVIPQSYRKHFKKEFKSRASHDVLAVCRPCHDRYNVFEQDYRNYLDTRFNFVSRIADPEGWKRMHRVSSAAKALLMHGDKLPKDREDMMLEILIDYLNAWPEREDLVRLSSLWPVRKYEKSQTIGQYIAEVCSDDELNEIARGWRLHFVQTMNPQYLPPFWSINRPLGVC